MDDAVNRNNKPSFKLSHELNCEATCTGVCKLPYIYRSMLTSFSTSLHVSVTLCAVCAKGCTISCIYFFYIMCMSQNIGCLTASKSKKLNALMALSFHT